MHSACAAAELDGRSGTVRGPYTRATPVSSLPHSMAGISAILSERKAGSSAAARVLRSAMARKSQPSRSARAMTWATDSLPIPWAE